MIDDDGKLRGRGDLCAWERVSVWAQACVGPSSVKQRLVHTHRRWTHVRALMRALACLCPYLAASVCARLHVYARGDDFGKHGSRVGQWQHADSTAGQPAIRNDEMRATEMARAREWPGGMTGVEENRQGLRRVIMNVCCRRLSLHFRCFYLRTDLPLLRPIATPCFLRPVMYPTFANSVHARAPVARWTRVSTLLPLTKGVFANCTRCHCRISSSWSLAYGAQKENLLLMRLSSEIVMSAELEALTYQKLLCFSELGDISKIGTLLSLESLLKLKFVLCWYLNIQKSSENIFYVFWSFLILRQSCHWNLVPKLLSWRVPIIWAPTHRCTILPRTRIWIEIHQSVDDSDSVNAHSEPSAIRNIPEESSSMIISHRVF